MSADTTRAPAPPQQRAAPAPRRRLASPRVLPVLATFVLFVAMFGIGSARYDGFFSLQVLLNLFIDNAYLIVLAVGMTFVILTGGIDLSVGSVVALSTMVAAWTLHHGWPPVLAAAAVLLVGTSLGLLTGLVIQYLDIQPFIATLAGMFLARGLCFLISVESIPIRNHTFFDISAAQVSLPGGLTITPTVLVAVVVVVVAAWVLHRTTFGRTVYAVGGSEGSALLMGLRVARTKVAVYAISGFCSALAGLLFSLYMLSGYSLHAVGMELDAIAAVVIGGTLLTGGRGLVVGSLLGVQFKFGEAKTMLEKCLAIEEPELGPDHPDVGRTLHDLANQEVGLEDYPAATAHYEQARAIFAARYGEVSEMVAGTDMGLGHISRAQWHVTEARRYYEHAAATFQAVLPAGHPTFAILEDSLAWCDRDENNDAAAAPHLRKAIEIRERAGESSIGLADDHVDLATVLWDLEKDDEARPHAERGLALHEQLGTSPAGRVNAWLVLQELEADAGHRARAIELANKILAGLGEDPREDWAALRKRERARIAELSR